MPVQIPGSTAFNPAMQGCRVISGRFPAHTTSSLGGKISTIFLSFADFESRNNHNTFSGLSQVFTEMVRKRSDVRFMVMMNCNTEGPQGSRKTYIKREQIIAHLKAEGIDPSNIDITFVDCKFKKMYSGLYLYLRDIFVFGNDSTIILPAKFRHLSIPCDISMLKNEIDMLADTLGLKVVVSDLVFEGGDILFTDNLQFICINTILSNIEGIPTREKIEAVKKRFEEYFGRKAVIVWTGKPERIDDDPLFHVDMFLTPLGRNEVLLPDPELGFDMLTSLPGKAFEEAHQKIHEERKKLVREGLLDSALIENPQEDEEKWSIAHCCTGLLAANSEFKDPNSFYYKEIKGLSKDLGLNLKIIENNLRMQGITVAGRLPFLYLWTFRHAFTYHNMLLEDYTDISGKRIRRALLGISGITIIDDYVADVIRSRDFEAVPISGAYELLGIESGGGGLHCVTNEIRPS